MFVNLFSISFFHSKKYPLLSISQIKAFHKIQINLLSYEYFSIKITLIHVSISIVFAQSITRNTKKQEMKRK